MTEQPTASAASRPADEPAPHLPGGARRRNLLHAASRWLGRTHIAVATGLLALLATMASVSLAVVMMEIGFYGSKAHVAWGAAGVTLTVATPIIYQAQRIIRRLAASQRSLKLMTGELALALHKAERASEEKSHILAAMSHELRTPLNAVIGFSDIMMNERLGPMANARYRDYARDINNSGQHLLEVINGILDLARIEAGAMALDEEGPCDLAEAVEAAITMVGPLAARQSVALDVELPDTPLRLQAVGRMLRQILINILSNAVKFTPEQGRVSLTAALRPNGNLAIAIADTGPGMSPEEVRVALTPFGQVRNPMSERHSGSGLGLPLAKAMLELHDGRLAVRSGRGRGTTVLLLFPAARVLPAPPAEPAATAQAARFSPKS